jgi:hypothetical protein
MAKRVFIVHGWDGYPEEGWFPWLKKELENKGFEVFVPQMPKPEEPRIYNWVPALAEAVGQADGETYFVGHSMGCQTIVRYLETLPVGVKVGGAVFVSGFFKELTNIGDDEEIGAEEAKEVADHWLKTPIDWDKVTNHLDKNVAIFSDDDPYVPASNQTDFKDKLGSEIIVEHAKGHFSGSEGVTELPVVLDSILKIS